MTKPGCADCRALTREHNVAISNGLYIKAMLVRNRLDAHEREHKQEKTCCPAIPTTHLGRDLIEAWLFHDMVWHGNLFLKREADGSYSRLNPTTVTVSPREGYQGGSFSMHEDS